MLGRTLRFEVISDDEARATLPSQLGHAYAHAQFDIFRERHQAVPPLIEHKRPRVATALRLNDAASREASMPAPTLDVTVDHRAGPEYAGVPFGA